MTAAELLKPRKIVELDYPNSPFKIGEILEFDEKENKFYLPFEGDKIFYNINHEKYPHIFKPLNWWEHRKVEDMTKKVIFKEDGKVEQYNIINWEYECKCGVIQKAPHKIICTLFVINNELGYFPID